MAILIICDDRDLTPWINALKAIDHNIDIRIYPEEGDIKEIEFIICWKHPYGILKRYPNLKAITSLGAGVDHLFADPDLPLNIPIARIVDPELAQAMSEFVIGLIFNHIRSLSDYIQLQKQKTWKSKPFNIARNVRVGIMGMGILGTDLARKLSVIGFQVSGWAQSKKELEFAQVYVGDSDLPAFLSGSNILVCLLPLTPKTKNILNKKLFEQLPDQAYLINVARGGHLVDEDLMEMIDRKKIAGAGLDVFRQEPLPLDHPFWEHPSISIFPHIASITNPISVAPQIIDNYKRALRGQPLLNKVSVDSGY